MAVDTGILAAPALASGAQQLWNDTYYARVRVAAAAQRLAGGGITQYGRMAPAENAALEKLAMDTGESFSITGGYAETPGGVAARKLGSGTGLGAPGMNLPGWRHTGAPQGRDVDLWEPASPQVESGIRKIFGFGKEFDYWANRQEYHPWAGIDLMPPVMKTYIPGLPMQQTIPPWDVSRWQLPN